MTPNCEFLVSHGCAAALSRCRNGEVSPRRGDDVVIRSTRGLEIATVLCEATPDLPTIAPAEFLRFATFDDHRRSREAETLGRHLLDDAQNLIETQSLPLAPLDAEVMLDRSQAVVHLLRWGESTLTPFIEELQSRHGLKVVLLDRSKPEEHHHGCGSCGEGGGGCGEGGCSTGGGGCSTGGGCSSGSCSRGSIKSADELTKYFSGLREQMHAMERVPLL
jgi:uncharacterized membrane protein YgcG